MNPTDPLSVTLEAQQWNQVLAMLLDGPYRISAPIIQAIHAQLMPETQKKADNVYPMEAG